VRWHNNGTNLQLLNPDLTSRLRPAGEVGSMSGIFYVSACPLRPGSSFLRFLFSARLSSRPEKSPSARFAEPTVPHHAGNVAAGEKGEAPARRGSRVFCKGKKISATRQRLPVPPTVAVIHVVGAPLSHPWSQCPLAGGRWTKPSYQPWPSETSASRSRTAVVDIPIGDLVLPAPRKERAAAVPRWLEAAQIQGRGRSKPAQSGRIDGSDSLPR